MPGKNLTVFKRTQTSIRLFIFLLGLTFGVWQLQPPHIARAETVLADQSGPTFTVNTSADDLLDTGCSDTHCTLRDAINAANSTAGNDTIVFDVGDDQTITLTSPLPNISALNGALTVDGETHHPTISGNDQYRVFTVDGSAQLTLTHITVADGNYSGGDCSGASCGGGIKVNIDATVNLTDMTIKDSYAKAGGAIYNLGTINLTDVSIQNSSADEGGGILNYGGNLNISSSVIKNNTALYGGGILIINGTVDMTNSTISGNSATSTNWTNGGGGAIDLYNGILTLNFCTITNNSAVSPNQSKSGLWLENGTFYLKNSIVSNNNGANNFYQSSGNFYPQGYNFSNGWNGMITLASDISGDPGLQSLADNGGKTSTHALMDTSLAIDAANPTGCLSTDQRGLSRDSGACDIGAFEFQDEPADITLSTNSIQENQPVDSAVGTFSTVIDNSSYSITYTLVSGTGSTDNGSFNISDDSLRTSASFNYETQSSYSIRVRTTDQNEKWYEKVFTITVTDVNDTPTDISLSASSVAENAAVNTVVGTLSTTDPDSGNTFTYTLASGTGGTDNGSFNISGDSLRTSALFDYDTQSDYSIRVRTTDQSGLWFEEVFTITITQPLTNITLTNTSVTTAQSIVGILDTAGGKKTYTYTLQNSGTTCNSTNGADNDKFQVDGNALRRLETTLAGTYQICFQTKDSNNEIFQKSFTIEVSTASLPDSTWTVELTSNKVMDGDSAGTLVGTAVSSVTGTTFQLIDSTIFPQNSSFNLSSSGSLTLAVSVNIKLQNTYSIRIRATTPDGRTKIIDAVIKVMKDGKDSEAAAENDNAVVIVGSEIEVDVQANDKMSNGAVSWNTLEIVQYPDHGTARIGSIIYSPDSGYVGLDSLTYRSCDNRDFCVVGKLTLIVRVSSDKDNDIPGSGFSPNRVTILPASPVTSLYSDAGDIDLTIPSLGINASIVGIPLSESGWDITWLGNNVGWLNGSAFPTQSGNSVLTGHVYNSDGTPGIFVNLSQLRWGDSVIIQFNDHSYVYEVRQIIDNVDPSSIETLLVHKDNPWLTLVTCKGYDEETNSYRWRYLVRAVLIEIE